MKLIKSIDLLEEADAVSVCRKCPELCSTRTKTVYSRGSSDARLMIIGEAPGADEDKKGEPFVGRAGQLLDVILKACELEEKDVYICNILKCRPPKNRLPAPEEIKNCIGFLHRQIEIVNPDFILCLGSVASGSLIGLKISQAREKWHSYKGKPLICTYHPAYLLRNPDAKALVREDLKPLLAEMRRGSRKVEEESAGSAS